MTILKGMENIFHFYSNYIDSYKKRSDLIGSLVLKDLSESFVKSG